MRTASTLLAVLVVSAASSQLTRVSCNLAAAGEKAQDDAKEFQGAWVPVYVEKGGKPIAKEGIEDLKALEVNVNGEKVVLKEDGEIKEDWDVSFKIDPTKSPKTIDISMSVMKFEPTIARGIYKFDGDTLVISIYEPHKDDERPMDFTTKEGAKNLLWRLKRK